MAFGINNIKKQEDKSSTNTDVVQEESVENQSDENNLEFLNPTKDAAKDSQNDPYREEITKKNAFQNIMKTLNALKIVSPIISALMQRPGVEAKNEELSESFRNLITHISTMSEKVCEKLEVDAKKEKNYWIRNVLERNFSQILGEQWISTGKINTTEIESFIDDVIKFSDTVSENDFQDNLDKKTVMKLALINSMTPILKEVSDFNLMRDFTNDILPIMSKLNEKAKEATTQLADPYATSDERVKLYYLLLKEAGNLYAVSWKIESVRIKNIMNSYDKEKLQNSIEQYKNKGGFPLNKVDAEFEKYYDKIIAVSEKLVVNQSGSIKNRLKNK